MEVYSLDLAASRDKDICLYLFQILLALLLGKFKYEIWYVF